MRCRTVALTLAVALAGCHPAQAGPVEADLGAPFTVAGGQEAVIRGADLRLRFSEVLEDSRCPTQVECFWTGQARIAVQVRVAGAPTTVQFNTNPAPGQTITTVDVGGYAVELVKLDPYPQTPDDSPALADYRATLSVRRR